MGGTNRRDKRAVGVIALAAWLALSPAPARPEIANDGPAASLILASGALAQLAPARPAEMPLEVRQSIGCLMVGTVGTSVTLAGGGIGVLAGLAGSVGAPGAGALTLGLTGLVFGTFCAVGAVLTPLYVYVTQPRRVAPPPPRERHAEGPPALQPPPPALTTPISLVRGPGDDVRTAAFRAGVLTPTLAPR